MERKPESMTKFVFGLTPLRIEDHAYPEEDCKAAIILQSLKYATMTTETAKSIEEMKAKNLARIRRHSLNLNTISMITSATMESKQPRGIHNTASCSTGSTSAEIHIPRLPPVEKLQGLIKKCSEPFRQTLTPSDVRDQLSRLVIKTMNFKDFIMPLLNHEEDIVEGIEVTTYDRRGKVYPMTFKIWAKKYYVLSTGWKQFYHEHDLQANKDYQDFLTLWAFRHVATKKLCFAIFQEEQS